MLINFNLIQEKEIKNFKNGDGSLFLKMFEDADVKIMEGRLEPGSSIGLHAHDVGYEIIMILSGNGLVKYDDVQESVIKGDIHYCPRGHKHTLINNSNQDLCYFAIVGLK